MMNGYMAAKIEAALELSSSAEDFKEKAIKVTGLTHDGFFSTPMTATAYAMLSRGESVIDTVNAVA